MQTQQTPSTPPSKQRRLGGPLIAAAAFVVVIVSVVIAVALLSTDTPDVATPVETVATTVETDDISGISAAGLASDFAAAINQGDLEAALVVLSPQSNCDFPIPGSDDLLVLDLRFADDASVHEAFMAYALGSTASTGTGIDPCTPRRRHRCGWPLPRRSRASSGLGA